jgi:hypothetical protein
MKDLATNSKSRSLISSSGFWSPSASYPLLRPWFAGVFTKSTANSPKKITAFVG